MHLEAWSTDISKELYEALPLATLEYLEMDFGNNVEWSASPFNLNDTLRLQTLFLITVPIRPTASAPASLRSLTLVEMRYPWTTCDFVLDILAHCPVLTKLDLQCFGTYTDQGNGDCGDSPMVLAHLETLILHENSFTIVQAIMRSVRAPTCRTVRFSSYDNSGDVNSLFRMDINHFLLWIRNSTSSTLTVKVTFRMGNFLVRIMDGTNEFQTLLVTSDVIGPLHWIGRLTQRAPASMLTRLCFDKPLNLQSQDLKLALAQLPTIVALGMTRDEAVQSLIQYLGEPVKNGLSTPQWMLPQLKALRLGWPGPRQDRPSRQLIDMISKRYHQIDKKDDSDEVTEPLLSLEVLQVGGLTDEEYEALEQILGFGRVDRDTYRFWNYL